MVLKKSTVVKKSRRTKKKMDSYKFEDVLGAATKYFNGEDLPSTTWINKYCVKDSSGNYFELTPDDMHSRLADEFFKSEVESTKKVKDTGKLSEYGRNRKQLTRSKIYHLIHGFRYIIPQGSIMSILGNDKQIGSLSNCVVIDPPHDSYAGICYSDQQLAQLMKRRCGVGVDISDLRPAGTHVSNAAISSTGSVSFMERFSNTTREVAQGGRRGALMITMDVRHPDIEAFISVKADLTKVTGANISVRLSDDFMNAVENDDTFDLCWPCNSDNIYKTVNAKELWMKINESAHSTAEPGLIFWDTQHNYSPSSVYPQYENSSTNPCSEIAMQGGDTCRLMCMNLYSFVKNPFIENAQFDFELFYEYTYEAQRLMDDVVDLEIKYIDRILEKVASDDCPVHIKEIEKRTWMEIRFQAEQGRRTGLGFTGLGDCLAAQNIKFDSDDALTITDMIMKVKCEAEWDSSIDMAVERGPFAGFDPNIEKTSDFIQMLKSDFPEIYNRNMKYGRRNVSISTVAPTGTVSLMANVSSGIEPVYQLSYTRRRKVNPNDPGAKVDFVDDLGDSWMEFDTDHPQLAAWRTATKKTNLEESPYWGCTASDINWSKRVKLQGIVQKYITHSISSTINLPSDVTVDEVCDIYMDSWKHGLKGITIYRDGCRSGVLISKEPIDEDKNEEVFPSKRPDMLQCDIHYSTIEGNEWIFFVGQIDGQPYEIFGGQKGEISIPSKYKSGWIKKNKRSDSGIRTYDLYLGSVDGDEGMVIKDLASSFRPDLGTYTRMVSTMLRHYVPIHFICEQLHKTSDINMFTFEKGISRVLKKYINDGQTSADYCASCETKSLKYENGCIMCTNCGFSGCS